MENKRPSGWYILFVFITAVLVLGFYNRVNAQSESLKRLINVGTQTAQPCDTPVIKVIMDCPPKLPMKAKTKVSLSKPTLAPTPVKRDTNVVNVDVKTGTTVYNDIYLPEPVNKTTILFSKGSIWNYTGDAFYLAGATCFIIGACRHYELTYISLNNIPLLDKSTYEDQRRIQMGWFIAGGANLAAGFILNAIGWHYTKTHFVVTPKTVGIVKYF